MADRLLDPATIAEVHAVLDANLAHLCDIQTNTTPNPNSGGGIVPTWESAPALVPCQLSARMAGRTENRNDQPEAVGDWKVRFQAGRIVTEDNRLVVTGENEGVEFVKLLIINQVVPTPVSTYAYCREATAAESDE